MQLSEHFQASELGVENAPDQVVENAAYICEKLLEPIRAQFGPIVVDDGYRPPAENQAAGGKAASYHLYDGTHSAADIKVPGALLTDVFDWIKNKSELPFDKVILEFRAGVVPDTPACIHLQVDSDCAPRRQAYTGYTGACMHYTPQSVS